jgi:putative phosphoserine phosphatase/1-acylglycerol-3-phosphate O-acyltransferase
VRTAVFDVDRTLLPGTTAERLFVRRLWREGEIGWRQVLAGLLFSLGRPRPALVMEWRAHRPYLEGKDCRTVAAVARRCFEQDIQPRLSRRGLERLGRHRAEGLMTVLLSGSLAQIIEPMREAVGADLVIASRLRVRNDRLTGGLEGLHPYGAVKATLVEWLAREQNLQLNDSYCYADHHTDVPMLELFGHPVCVNPSARLRAVAQRLGWPIEEFA